MGPVGMLLITVLATIVLACIIGVAVGVHQRKKEAGLLRPLLSGRERAVFASSVAVGVILLLVGIFYQPSQNIHPGDMGMMDDSFFVGERDFGGMEVVGGEDVVWEADGHFYENGGGFDREESEDGYYDALDEGEADSPAPAQSQAAPARPAPPRGSQGGGVVVRRIG